MNQTTFLTAYLQRRLGRRIDAPVDVIVLVDPMGIVMLDAVQGIQKVTGVAPGNVVVTASGFDQTAKVGITVVSP